MSDDIMAASANRPTPTPELLRCNAKVIRRRSIIRPQSIRTEQRAPSATPRTCDEAGLFLKALSG